MKAKYISYQETHSFSKLVLDYVNDDPFLKPFYSYRPDLDGLKQAFESRNFKGNRAELVEV
ncbi:MAG: bacillithiol biosynthesis BshC, partial [Chitinophagaceae bacterium]